MQELTQLFTECLYQYNKCEVCDGNSCKQGFYCVANNCTKGKCDKCLNHIQWNPSPQFHYSCEKITYHYVLRFFNRFASEIAYAVCTLNGAYLNGKRCLNVVSLGCGPGSEVYGFIYALRSKAPHIVLNYQGYDMNSIWASVQQKSLNALAGTPHNIGFNNMNMFAAYSGFQEGGCDMLLLNYLLSDAQKYYTNTGKVQFLKEIARFVYMNGIKNIFFNDNAYYGTSGRLDSGVMMMCQLIKELKALRMQVKISWRYFPTINYVVGGKWIPYKHYNLLFQPLAGNMFDKNVKCCKSRQIIVHIN